MTRQQLLLTHYTLQKGARLVRGTHDHLKTLLETSSLWTGADLVMHQHLYRLGESVEVYSFGAWRPGEITSLGRSRVEVRYARNKNGDLHLKRFDAEAVRPRTTP